MKLTAKDRLRLYAYGGIGDEDKNKPVRKVTTVPDGYEVDKEYIDKNNPNRVYYIKRTITNNDKVISNSSSAKKAIKPTKSNYTTVKPRTSTTKKNTLDTLIDRIYLEPDQQTTVPEDTEVESFMGENIFTKRGQSNMAIGQARYPTRDSKSQKDDGNLNTQNQNVEFMYYKPNSSKIDKKKGKFVIPFDEWNNRGQTSNFADTAFINKYSPKMELGGEVGEGARLLEGLIGLLNNKRNITTQPILSKTAINNMSNPYSGMALGGTVEDLTQEEYEQLQQKADEEGVSVEELLDQMSQDLSASSSDDYMGNDENTEEDMSQNIYAYGGKSIEIEGDEVVHEPGKNPVKVKGPKHEQGGIDVNVKPGTRIYSNRLSIDGKTMQVRKIGRENRLKKINKLLEKYPNNMLTKNTVTRSLEHVDAEEEKDMMLQKVAKKLYSTEGEAGYGDVTGDSLYDSILGRRSPSYSVSDTSNIEAPISDPSELGTGDYIGMAGTLLGSISPLINSRNAARNTIPMMNRYQDFGDDALETNQSAQQLVGRSMGESLSDVSNNTESAIRANRNSANSINTGRALDIATFIASNKAKAGIRGNYDNNMIRLLGQESSLENQKDYYSSMGETAIDTAREQNVDNYYNNRGADLSNLSSGVQQIGRNLNISKSNKIDSNLISQLSQYGLSFDEDGNLVFNG